MRWILVLAALGACGDGKGSATDQPGPTTSEPTTGGTSTGTPAGSTTGTTVTTDCAPSTTAGMDGCEVATARMLAKFCACGIAPTTTGGTTYTPTDCTPDLQALSECYADCMEAAPCAVIAGTTTSMDEIMAFATCLQDCGSPATTP